MTAQEPEPEEDVASLLSTKAAISKIGRQITAAESARNHIVYDNLGEHLDALVSALSSLSK